MAKSAEELFDLMAYFAGYGFNKSHSAAYALIAYQTAYLKANYPAEFMACLISLEADQCRKYVILFARSKRYGHLLFCHPILIAQQYNFPSSNGSILFGLQGIKNVGLAALENIIARAQQKGPFKDLIRFLQTYRFAHSNKRVIEHLICAGAFDALPGNRAQKFEEEKIMDLAAAHKKDAATGQMGLFGALPN